MKRARATAFSMIEVVVALGIVSFALISIFGLFSLGLKTNKESSDQIQAADLTSLLISTRRGMPTNTLSGFALPPLNAGATNTVTVGIDGKTTTNSLPAADEYRLQYQIAVGTASAKVANVDLLLWWPATIATPPTNNPGGYYEVSTQVLLP